MKHNKKIRQAIRMLMKSPMYFRMNVEARHEMILEFCRLHLSAPVV